MSTPKAADRLLASLPRGDHDVRVRCRRLNGRLFVDVRVFGREIGRSFPTRAGVTIRANELERVIAALEAAKGEFANDKGEDREHEEDRDYERD